MHRVRGAAPKNAALPPGAREPFTWEVWPWSHLVPLFVDDITARVGGICDADMRFEIWISG